MNPTLNEAKEEIPLRHLGDPQFLENNLWFGKQVEIILPKDMDQYPAKKDPGCFISYQKPREESVLYVKMIDRQKNRHFKISIIPKFNAYFIEHEGKRILKSSKEEVQSQILEISDAIFWRNSVKKSSS